MSRGGETPPSTLLTNPELVRIEDSTSIHYGKFMLAGQRDGVTYVPIFPCVDPEEEVPSMVICLADSIFAPLTFVSYGSDVLSDFHSYDACIEESVEGGKALVLTDIGSDDNWNYPNMKSEVLAQFATPSAVNLHIGLFAKLGGLDYYLVADNGLLANLGRVDGSPVSWGVVNGSGDSTRLVLLNSQQMEEARQYFGGSKGVAPTVNLDTDGVYPVTVYHGVPYQITVADGGTTFSISPAIPIWG